jgi:hypothetical protein
MRASKTTVCPPSKAAKTFGSRRQRKLAETRWHPPTILGASEQRGRRSRSARSTVHSPGRRFCRRGATKRRSCPPQAHRHFRRTEPMLLRGCTSDRDRCRPESACTIRTMQRAVRHESSHGCDAGDGGIGDDDGVFGPLHSRQKRKAMRLQLRFYACDSPSCCWEKIAGWDQGSRVRGRELVQRRF